MNDFDVESKFFEVFDFIYEKRKLYLSGTDSTIYNLLDAEISTGKQIGSFIIYYYYWH